MKQTLQYLIEGNHLSQEEARIAMDRIMTGNATDAQIGAFLVAMRLKGEQAGEIAGFAASMRSNADPVPNPFANTIDLVGTGGDGLHTFNISTVASLVVAGAGVPVAKHGNRSVSSKCGSADVLMELGVNINLDGKAAGACLAEVGYAFLFAPRLHPAMKYAIGPRREIGVRSVFNILGPICNPAGVRHQLIGVYDLTLARLLAEVLNRLGAERVLMVHSGEGMDEISIAGETHIVELNGGQISEYRLSPADFGLQASSESIVGGDAATNAAMARAVLGGASGAARDIVLANAGAALMTAGAVPDLRSGVTLAAESIDSGKALKILEELIRYASQYS